jgi:small subunit ribosomal protein S20
MSRSRTSPVTREARVSKETVEAALNNVTAHSVCAAPAVRGTRPGATCTHLGSVGYNARLCWQHPQTPRNIYHGIHQAQEKEPAPGVGPQTRRQDVKLNAANTSLRSKYRTAVKNVEKAVLAGDKTKATELFAKMQSVVDTVADKGIFHKNKAARDKSRLSAKVKALALAAA